MGRKINPLLFRSKYKFKKTNWVTTDDKYKSFLQEDNKLRSVINNILKKKRLN